MCVGWPVPEFGHLPDVIVRKPEPFNRCSVAGADLDHDVRVHRVDDDRVFLSNDGDIEKSSAPLGRRPRSRGASAVRLADGMLERRLDGSLRRSLNAAVTAQSSETLVHEEGVDMPTATGDARIEIDATALTVHNLVSDSNCMVQ